MRELFTSTTPEPFGLRERFPLVLVVEISLPLRLILSTCTSVRPPRVVSVPPKEMVLLPIVIELFASSAFATPPSLIVTTPEDTAKLSAWNCAIPFALVLASLIATSPEVTVKYEPEKEAIPLFEALASSPETVAVPEE